MILDLIRTECGLEPSLWNHQRIFFQNLLQGTFRENDDSPAWVVIAGPRRSFMERRETKGKIINHNNSKSIIPQYVFGAPKIIGEFDNCRVKQPLILQSRPVKQKRLLLIGPADVAVKDLRLWTTCIQRQIILHGDQTRWSFSRERWSFLASHGDQNEQNLMSNGYNPSLEQFRLRDQPLQTSPLISLARYSRATKTVYGLSFSLNPGKGQVVDFREIEQPIDFALNTDLINTSVLLDSTRISSSDSL